MRSLPFVMQPFCCDWGGWQGTEASTEHLLRRQNPTLGWSAEMINWFIVLYSIYIILLRNSNQITIRTSLLLRDRKINIYLPTMIKKMETVLKLMQTGKNVKQHFIPRASFPCQPSAVSCPPIWHITIITHDAPHLRPSLTVENHYF